MKIAFVIHDINKEGGQERYSAELIEIFSAGHEVHVFASTMRGVKTNERVIFHKVPVIRSFTPLKSLLFFIISSLMVRRHGFDVIHGNGGNFCGADVITAHFCHRGWHKAIKQFADYEIGWLKKYYQKMVIKMDTLMEKYVYRSKKYKMIIANSKKTKEELCRFYGVQEKKVKVIYMGVDINLFNPLNKNLYKNTIRNAFKIPIDSCLLLFAGAMERKGLIYIIRSLSLLKKENISLIVIGRGIDENYFKREAEKNGVGDLIRFAGQREDIHKFYASADIFVLPAIYEPFGMAIAEAMASGLPVVVSRQTGISEIISDGEDGILLDRPDAPEEIAHRLLPLIRDSEMRLKIGQRARKKAESLSWDLIAEETMRVYINLKNKNLI